MSGNEYTHQPDLAEIAQQCYRIGYKSALEAAAKECENRMPHGKGKVGALEGFVSRELASSIRALLPAPQATQDDKGEA